MFDAAEAKINYNQELSEEAAEKTPKNLDMIPEIWMIAPDFSFTSLD